MSIYARDPDAYHNFLVRQVELLSPDTLRHTLQSPDSGTVSHLITLTKPSPASRSRPEKVIDSRVIFELLWDKHIKFRAAEMEALYDLFQSNTFQTSSAAGWMFELRMHQVLRQENSISLYRIHGRRGNTNLIYDDYAISKSRKHTMAFQLTESEELPLDEGIKLDIGRYYRSRALNFPTIDSLALIHPPREPSPILLMFQITRNKTQHEVEESGLVMVNGLQLPPGTRKVYVVVTPQDRQPQITAPKKYFIDQGMGKKKADKVFQVFHCPINTRLLFSPTPRLG
jgi:hypothetical protein